MIKCKKRKGIISMNVALIITCIIAVALLILAIASKTMNILIGLITTIAGIVGYFWMGSPESWMTQLKIAIEFQIEPSQLRMYCLSAVIIGVVLLIIGLMRGKKKKEKVVVVKQETSIENKKPARSPARASILMSAWLKARPFRAIPCPAQKRFPSIKAFYCWT